MSVRRILLSLAAALCVGALTPGVAAAANLSESSGEIDYSAAAGEANKLTVESDGASLIFTDAGAPITPTAPCTPIPGGQAKCPLADVESFMIDLLDLSNQVTIAASVPAFQTYSYIYGGPVDDTMTVLSDTTGGYPIDLGGEAGPDVITGGPGYEIANPGPGNDLVSMNGGSDSINDDAGDDSYDGGAGGDFFDASSQSSGADVYVGGDGDDFIAYSQRKNPIAVSLDGVANDGEGCGGGTCEGDNVMPDMEDVFGGTSSDAFTGTPSDNEFHGGRGDDTLVGGAGDDRVYGEEGNDTVSGDEGDDQVAGGDGTDAIAGGPGDDLLSPDFTDHGADTLSGGDGIDSLSDSGGPLAISLDGVANDLITTPNTTYAVDNVGADIENVSGSESPDVIIGSDAANVLTGGRGDDILVGGGGEDTLEGDDGADRLDAGAGNDSLLGGAGSDLLLGRDAFADQIDCGSSDDAVLADALDTPKASCEASSDGAVIGRSPRVKGTKIRLKVNCPAIEGIDCQIDATVSANGQKVAAGKSTIPSSATKAVALKVTDDGRGLLDKPGALVAQAKVTFVDSAGVTVTTKRKVTIP